MITWFLLYYGMCAGGCFFLWKIRDRQPGNTRYSVAIYCGMGALFLMMIFGLKLFGLV